MPNLALDFPTSSAKIKHISKTDILYKNTFSKKFHTFYLRLRKLMRKWKTMSNELPTRYNSLLESIKINRSLLLHEKVFTDKEKINTLLQSIHSSLCLESKIERCCIYVTCWKHLVMSEFNFVTCLPNIQGNMYVYYI